MPLYSQQTGINSVRVLIDDGYGAKLVTQFSPLQGILNGTNTTFQIPQSRITLFPAINPTIFPQLFKNIAALIYGTDYTLTTPKQGRLNLVAAPLAEDSLTCTFNWNWFDDVEMDSFLTNAAQKVGFTSYYTTSSNIPNTLPVPSGGNLPTDIPSGLFDAITELAGSLAAKALSMRFAMKYDISAGDQSFSPSQMAKAYSELSTSLEKSGLNARDDFYKGQGRQYSPSTAQQGYVLPNWTPRR